ncbi:alpha-amylase family protein [Natronobacterium texcoconense]|uniref:Uncharacterized protein n=1 Tax=Natronobacterium texcoconense TaxID=1095778 RepID=A0A1H1FV18_NATTX|nr:hypothetical protein [Natronobacterium texcoconense]SDR04751.1 hypothetical protein SAMN04489842_2127 [Natronobacterium texcoconense]
MLERGTSYFGVRNVDHATRDLDRFADAGLNAVLHTFSERDLQYYRGTLERTIEASHERGFTVYVNPWGVGRVFGGEALSEFVGRHPEARQRLSSGDAVPAACFNHPTFRRFVQEWTEAAVGIGADVVFWDEPHWFISEWADVDVPEGAWACHCDHCQRAYERRYDEPLPDERTDRTDEFREESLLEFLEETMAVVRDAGARNAVCLLPRQDAAHGLSDWDTLAASDHLDVFATDPYWDAFEHATDATSFVAEYTDRVVALADQYDLQSQIWIQGFRLDDDPETIRTVEKATKTAVEGGVDSVFTWGYDGCASISSIACDDPEAVWNTYLDALPD